MTKRGAAVSIMRWGRIKKIGFCLSLFALLVLKTSSGLAQVEDDKMALLEPGTLAASNGFYDIFVQDAIGNSQGLYTIRTGSLHPIPGRNLLFGGERGLPATSFNTIRSYTSRTDYVQGRFGGSSSTFSVKRLGPFGTINRSGTTGIVTTYTLPGPPTTPDALTITQLVQINGTTLEDSSVEITTTVQNTGSTPMTIGVRYLWDFQIGRDDGPILIPNNPTGDPITTEVSFMLPVFQSFSVEDNDFNDPTSPLYTILGTVNGPSGIIPIPTRPDLLQNTCWGLSFRTAFDYTTSEGFDVATGRSSCRGFSGGDTAVLYYFGPTEGDAIILQPGESITLSASLFATLPQPVLSPEVRIIDTISAGNIDLDMSSFSHIPTSITMEGDKTVIEWVLSPFKVGQMEDLSFEVILRNPIPGEDREVNHRLELLYTDVGGNEVRTELGPEFVHVLNSAFTTGISTDKTDYTANEDALIDLSITNLSDFGRTIDAVVAIEDDQGNLVESVTTLSDIVFAAGETQSFLALVYNTASTFSGDYRVHATLTEAGNPVGEATASFTILPVISTDTVIVSDKIAYNAGETVTLTSTATSTSANFTLSGYSADVSVSGPDGNTIFSETRALSDLLPAARIEFKSYMDAGTLTPGSYTATLNLLDASAVVLSTAMAALDILSSATTGAGLTGTIVVSPDPVYQGQLLAATYTVTNLGNAALSNIPLSILIVDPDTGMVMTTLSEIVNLPMGAAIGNSLSASTLTLIPTTHLAILQVTVGGNALTLASTNFEVLPGLEITKSIPDDSRLLVWINDGCGQTGNGNGNQSTCIRTDLIESALLELEADYTLAMSKSDFETELRSNYYTDYLILGDYNPLTSRYGEELREHVFSGSGLITSPWIGEDEEGELFGIKVAGKLKQRDNMIEFMESALFTAMSFPSYGKAARLTQYNESDVLAWITDSDGLSYPGVIQHSYGLGLDLYMAFDLGLSATDEDYVPFVEILRSALGYVHRPQETEDFLPYDLAPIEIELASRGLALDVRITETYPVEIQIFDAATRQWITDNPWVQEIHLDAGEAKSIRLLALMPDLAGSFTLTTDVDILQNGAWVPFEMHTMDLTVDRDRATLISDTLDTLYAITPASDEEANSIAQAIGFIEKARDRDIISSKNLDQSIHDIIKAIEAVMGITSLDTQPVRLEMDSLLAISSEMWYLAD